MARRPLGVPVTLALAIAVAALVPMAARGQSCVTSGDDSAAVGAAGLWAAPLDRRISLHARAVSLRDALDRVAAEARLHLSYSAELLPLDAVACVAADSIQVGSLLVGLLRGTTVRPVSAGGDQIVLAPRPAPPGSAPGMLPSVGMLDRVLVTGSATAAPERPLTVAVDVVNGATLRLRDATTLSDALDGAVPGIWAWSQSPSSLLASYASIRGASSFGLSYPKIYIDGIEVASPLLVTQFSPGEIDHIEVIRGPQEAALYGADAISGVINIVTRHDGVDADGNRVSLQSEGGVTSSDFVPHDAFTQEHSVALRSGSSTQSLGLDVTAGTMGNVVPNGDLSDLSANANARIIGSRWSISGLARGFAEQAGSGASPILLASLRAHGDSQGVRSLLGNGTPQTVGEATVGSTGTFIQSDRWTHSLVVGLDGYRLANVATDATPIPSEADSALRAAQGGAERGTVRLSSVAQLGPSEQTGATVTFSAEQSDLAESTVENAPSQPQPPQGKGKGATPTALATVEEHSWEGTSGATMQVDAAWHNTLFATAGARAERDVGFISTSQTALLPLVGLAAVEDQGPLTIKLRAAYGKGIRPAEAESNGIVFQTLSHATQPTLSPEVQSGIEAGIDLIVHNVGTVQITRFDQDASGLIQQVAVADTGRGAPSRIDYQLENVGEIRNTGWELQGSTQLSRLSLEGTLSLVDSRVVRLADGYTGDLQPGDRMLDVPERTMSLSGIWNEPRWHLSLTASRASDWINYDELALATAFAGGNQPAPALVGAQLRNYWITYDGVTRLRATASMVLRREWSLEVSGDNLLNIQRGEPDNVTVLPGRTILTGLRVRF